MFVELEGGCRVVGLKEGAPLVDGDLRVWPHFDGPLSLRILELHGQTTLHDDDHEKVLYALDGPHENTGIHVPAGASLSLSGEMTLMECGRPARPRSCTSTTSPSRKRATAGTAS